MNKNTTFEKRKDAIAFLSHQIWKANKLVKATKKYYNNNTRQELGEIQENLEDAIIKLDAIHDRIAKDGTL